MPRTSVLEFSYCKKRGRLLQQSYLPQEENKIFQESQKVMTKNTERSVPENSLLKLSNFKIIGREQGKWIEIEENN